MRRTRFMTQLFLVLSLAFFFVEDFRWGLWGPAARVGGLGGLVTLSSDEVRSWEQPALVERDARTLAFAACALGKADGLKDAVRLANHAVGLDRSLTWVYLHVAWSRGTSQWAQPPLSENIESWIGALEAYSPDNAVPVLMRAELLRRRAEMAKTWRPSHPEDTPASKGYLDNLAAQTEWRAAMSRAFEKPRYDAWMRQRFDLDRDVLGRHGWLTPLALTSSVMFYPIPSLANARDYTALEVHRLGREAEDAGQLDEALAHYRKVILSAERMGLEGKTVIEELIALDTRKAGTEAMAAALRKAGRAEEAALWDLEVMDVQSRSAHWGRKDPFVRTSMRFWSALMVRAFAGMVVLFLVLSIVCVAYVNIKQHWRRDKRGKIYEAVTVSENYVTIILFVCCLGLYLIHTPYAHNFRYYASTQEEIRSFDPLFENVLPYGDVLPGSLWLPIEHPFTPYIYWALAGLVLIVAFASWQERRLRRRQAAAAPPAAPPAPPPLAPPATAPPVTPPAAIPPATPPTTPPAGDGGSKPA